MGTALPRRVCQAPYHPLDTHTLSSLQELLANIESILLSESLRSTVKELRPEKPWWTGSARIQSRSHQQMSATLLDWQTKLFPQSFTWIDVLLIGGLGGQIAFSCYESTFKLFIMVLSNIESLPLRLGKGEGGRTLGDCNLPKLCSAEFDMSDSMVRYQSTVSSKHYLATIGALLGKASLKNLVIHNMSLTREVDKTGVLSLVQPHLPTTDAGLLSLRLKSPCMLADACRAVLETCPRLR
jgi:hypothetical protein